MVRPARLGPTRLGIVAIHHLGLCGSVEKTYCASTLVDARRFDQSEHMVRSVTDGHRIRCVNRDCMDSGNRIGSSAFPGCIPHRQKTPAMVVSAGKAVGI